MKTWRIAFRDPQGVEFPIVVEAPDEAAALRLWQLLHPPRFGYQLEALAEAPGVLPHVHWLEHAEVVETLGKLVPASRWWTIASLLVLVIGTAGGMAGGYWHGLATTSHDPLPWGLAGFGVGAVVSAGLAAMMTRTRRGGNPPV